MSPSIGLMSTGIIMIVISIVGNRSLMISAPSSGVSLIVAPLVSDSGLVGLIMATFIMGLTQIIFGLCRMNRLIDIVPQGVVIGFMNALGIILLSSQLEHIFPSTITTYGIVVVSVCDDLGVTQNYKSNSIPFDNDSGNVYRYLAIPIK